MELIKKNSLLLALWLIIIASTIQATFLFLQNILMLKPVNVLKAFFEASILIKIFVIFFSLLIQFLPQLIIGFSFTKKYKEIMSYELRSNTAFVYIILAWVYNIMLSQNFDFFKSIDLNESFGLTVKPTIIFTILLLAFSIVVYLLIAIAIISWLLKLGGKIYFLFHKEKQEA